MSRIVGVKFYDKESGDVRGREYSYFDGLGDLEVGDLAVALVRDAEKTVQVTSVDIPESEVDEHVLPLLKTIAKRYVPPETEGTQEESFTLKELEEIENV